MDQYFLPFPFLCCGEIFSMDLPPPPSLFSLSLMPMLVLSCLYNVKVKHCRILHHTDHNGLSLCLYLRYEIAQKKDAPDYNPMVSRHCQNSEKSKLRQRCAHFAKTQSLQQSTCKKATVVSHCFWWLNPSDSVCCRYFSRHEFAENNKGLKVCRT